MNPIKPLAAPLIAALALAAFPRAALAEGCAQDARFQCPAGQHWDSATKSCLSPSS